MASEDQTQLPLGEALIQEGVITEGQLVQAAERLKQDQENGRTTTLTGTLTTLGMASDKAILTAINKVYGLGATALTPDIDERIERLGTGGLFGRVRVPISIKLSVTLAVFLLSVMMVLSYFTLKRQAENLYAESVKSGKISLTYFTTEAKIPLLNDDTLRLNSLISEVTQVEGLVYAVIAGRDGIIKAHNDLSQVGKPLVLAGREGPVSREDDGSSYFTRRLLDGTEILNLTAPVSFKGKVLGDVHVGISLDFIADRISKEKVFIYMMTVVFFLIGMAVAGLLGTNFSRPISRLVVATREISNGNYHHKVDFKRKDEFDDLGRAFNYMSHELWLKSSCARASGATCPPPSATSSWPTPKASGSRVPSPRRPSSSPTFAGSPSIPNPATLPSSSNSSTSSSTSPPSTSSATTATSTSSSATKCWPCSAACPTTRATTASTPCAPAGTCRESWPSRPRRAPTLCWGAWAPR